MRAVAFARSFPVWQPPTLPAPPPTRLGLPSRPDTRVGKPFARPVGYDDDDSTPRQDGKIPRPPFFGGACFPIPARPREGHGRRKRTHTPQTHIPVDIGMLTILPHRLGVRHFVGMLWSVQLASYGRHRRFGRGWGALQDSKGGVGVVLDAPQNDEILL